MSYTETAILLFYSYFSTVYMYTGLLCGFVSITYQIYDNYKSTRKAKQLFLLQTGLTFVMLCARLVVVSVKVGQGVMVFYCYTIFFEILGRFIACTEVLKLFIPLSTSLTTARVNMIHILGIVFHFTTFGGIFWYYISFQSPAESKPIAIWFRYGSFVNTIVSSIYVISLGIFEYYLIQKHVNAMKSTVSNLENKKKRVLVYIFVMILLGCISIVQFCVCVVVNAEAPNPGYYIYQYLIQINLTNCMFAAVFVPIVFHGIVALKFEDKGVVVAKMAKETRISWHKGDNTRAYISQ